MRIQLSILIVILMGFVLFGCSINEDDSQVINPVHESTAEEIIDKLGVAFQIPDDVVTVEYFIIDVGEEESIAQAVFRMNGIDYTYRIQTKSYFEDISGAYYEWQIAKAFDFNGCNGELRYNDDKEGICLWYDTDSGKMHSIFMGENASAEQLVYLANELYMSMEDTE